MRVEYGSVEKDGSSDLDADWLADGWLALLHRWITDAEEAGVAEPNAMVLATVEDGKPVSRAVLCKSVDETGVTFYTNYDSAKGADLAATPYAAVTFPWFALGRAGAHPRRGHQGQRAGDRRILVQAAARIPAGRLGVVAVPAHRVTRRSAGPSRRVDGTLRRRRAGAGAAALGWLPDRAGGHRVLAGPGEPDPQPHPGHPAKNLIERLQP